MEAVPEESRVQGGRTGPGRLRLRPALADVRAALERIRPRIRRTPLLRSDPLDRLVGTRLLFKTEHLQHGGAFKLRGAFNTLLRLQESGSLPERVVAYSSGNHARAVARAGAALGVPATIFMPRYASPFKVEATKAEGAGTVLCNDRNEAESRAQEAAANGAFLLPPYDHDDVICGQGTACLEALEDAGEPVGAVFAPCGGGGLLSGTWLAAQQFDPAPRVFGAEPLAGNDAARSLRDGRIFRFEHSPDTLADGAMTLGVSERTFHFLKKLDGLDEIPEDEIRLWHERLNTHLEGPIEPTAALGLAAAAWRVASGDVQGPLLVILSGGNVSPD